MDSLQAVIADFDNIIEDSQKLLDLRYRLERIDAEQHDRCGIANAWHGALRRSLIRACNATDGGCTDTVTDGFLANVGEEVELTIKKLRERLAAAEKDVERYRKIQYMGFTPPNDRFGRVLLGDKLSAWIDGRKSAPYEP